MGGDNDNNESKGIIKLNPSVIGAWIAVVIPLWGGIAYMFKYDQNVMKKTEYDLTQYVTTESDSFSKLEARIERTKILIAVYSRNSASLTEIEKNEYEAAKARLINLVQQRDKVLGVQ